MSKRHPTAGKKYVFNIAKISKVWNDGFRVYGVQVLEERGPHRLCALFRNGKSVETRWIHKVKLKPLTPAFIASVSSSHAAVRDTAWRNLHSVYTGGIEGTTPRMGDARSQSAASA